MIYWTDVTTQGSMIRRMHLNGSNVQVRLGWPTPQLTNVGIQRSTPSAPLQRVLSFPPPTYQLFPSPPSPLSHYMTLFVLASPSPLSPEEGLEDSS